MTLSVMTITKVSSIDITLQLILKRYFVLIKMSSIDADLKAYLLSSFEERAGKTHFLSEVLEQTVSNSKQERLLRNAFKAMERDKIGLPMHENVING
jgi:hypothetical protein